MENDRTDSLSSSGKSRADCVLPDMPPGDPPLQDTAITFRQDCEQRFAKAGGMGGGGTSAAGQSSSERLQADLAGAVAAKA